VNRRIFREEQTIADPNRQVAGIGPGAKDQGMVNINVPAEAQRDNTKAPDILPFQISNSIPEIARYITELTTMRNNLKSLSDSMGSDPKQNPSKQVVIDKLISRINKINTIFASDVMRLLDKLAI
jgi:hypothetical protein